MKRESINLIISGLLFVVAVMMAIVAYDFNQRIDELSARAENARLDSMEHHIELIEDLVVADGNLMIDRTKNVGVIEKMMHCQYEICQDNKDLIDWLHPTTHNQHDRIEAIEDHLTHLDSVTGTEW